MKKFVAPILGSALTALVAATALAASGTPAHTQDVKPAASAPAVSAPAAAPSAAPVAAATVAPAASDSKAPAKEQTVRIGFVDMNQVASETEEGKAATAALKSKSQKLSAKIEAKQKQIEKQKAAIEAKLETMAPKERAAKAKEFQKKMEEYQKLVRASDQEMKEMQEKLTEEMYLNIKNAAVAYGKSHGFAAVVVKKDTLFVSDSVDTKDISDDVIGVLNKKSAPKSK